MSQVCQPCRAAADRAQRIRTRNPDAAAPTRKDHP